MEERKEGIDPVWAQTGPPPAGTNLGAHWLTRVSRLLPSDVLPESPHVLDAIFCHSLSFDPSRSRSHHLFFNLVVSELLVNRYGTLHGGAIGALIEFLACYAIKSASVIKEGTVTDINISYISGTPIKEDIEFEVKVLKVDKSNGVASVDGRNKKSGKAALQGRVTMSFEPTSKL